MSKPFYQTKDFKTLEKQWNKKLKDSGFRDIESDFDRENRTGHKDHFPIDTARIVYFEKCLAYLHSTNFNDPLDKIIFEKHCEGISNRQITELIGNLDSRTVDRRLLKILKMAGIEPITFKF